MRRLVIVPALVAFVVVLVPATALAKGATEASITGPGLAQPLVLAGEGRQGGKRLQRIASESGFYPAVFEQTPDPMLDARPEVALGPRYVVRYAMPGPTGEQETIVQDLYPYASPAPISYVRPGQTFWTTEETRGGWFVAQPLLLGLLVNAGLPEAAPPEVAPPSDSTWRAIGPALAVAALALLGALVVARRRRPQPA